MSPAPSRLRHVPDEWLLAHDLRDADRLAAARLAQHQVAAHRTWGCSAGLDVHISRDRLYVGAGCAVDRCGRTVVLARQERLDVEIGEARVVVLHAVGGGPAGRVVLRAPDRVREGDIPLAAISAKGLGDIGDGSRQWLRRPGPTRIASGVVPRGAAVTGDVTMWTATVALARLRLDETPAITVTAAGPTPAVVPHAVAGAGAVALPVVTTTIAVSTASATAFQVTVAHLVDLGALSAQAQQNPGPPAPMRTSPFALAWTAVLPAARPQLPGSVLEEES